MFQYNTLKSTVLQYNSWHTGTGIHWTGKKLPTGGGTEVEEGRADVSSSIGGGGQAAISLMPDIDGTCSGSLLEPDTHFHLWKFIIWRFVCRGFTDCGNWSLKKGKEIPFNVMNFKRQSL